MMWRALSISPYVEAWRDEAAERLGMAPGAVLPSHLAGAAASHSSPRGTPSFVE